MSISKIACIGEAMIELSLQNGTHIGFAGDTLNTAIYLKRAWPKGQVSYVSALGRDVFSDRMIAYMQGENLDTSLIARTANYVPGLYAITLDGAGERSFIYWRENSAARQLFGADSTVILPDLAGFELIYLSGITLAILPENIRDELHGFLVEFRAQGGKVAFDSNYRPALWPDLTTARRVIADFWSICDIALPSLDDEMALFGDVDQAAVVARLKGLSVSFGALKRGSDGPFSLGAPVDMRFSQAVDIVDTTAAGDSFNAGFLAAVLQGKSMADCLKSGHDLALKIIAHPGAISPKNKE
ncbi:MAG: sugar kinase [Paracoccaceae bacterium]